MLLDLDHFPLLISRKDDNRDLERSLESANLKSWLEKISSQEILNSFRKGKIDEARRNDSKASLQELKENLSSSIAVLDDAHEKQFQDFEVKHWIYGIENVMYNLQYRLDEISTKSLLDELRYGTLINGSAAHECLFYLKWTAREMEYLARNVEDKLRSKEASRPICEPFQPATTNSEDEFVLFGRDETLPVKDDLKLDISKMVPLGSDHNQGTSNAPKTDLSISSHLESSKLTEDSTDTDNSEDSLEDTSSYESIKVSERWQMMTLPPQLHSLKIEGYDARNLPDELVHSNSHFRHLYIIDCCSLKSFQGGHLPNDLKTLYIRNCKDLEILPPAKTTGHYLNLERLCIGNSCDSIRYFPLACFPKLRSLVLRDCANLDSISMTEAHTSLNTLEIRDCHGLVSFPKGGLLMPNLKSILISNCKNLRELPDQLHKLTSLQSLFIKECPELVSIPEGGFPTKIILLCITSCHKLTPSTEWKLQSLGKLNHFEIDGGCRELKSFPVKKLLPTNLNSLRISRLPNLELLNYEGLQHLTSLATLEINCCDKLQSLPEEGLPSSLTSLYINECGLLKSKLEKKRRKDWHKITHIRRIQIDGKVIS